MSKQVDAPILKGMIDVYSTWSQRNTTTISRITIA